MKQYKRKEKDAFGIRKKSNHTIKTKIEKAVQNAVPKSPVRGRQGKKWMDRGTLETVRKKHKLFRKWLQTKCYVMYWRITQ